MASSSFVEGNMLKKKTAFVVDQAFVKCEVNHPCIFNDPK